MPRSNSPSYLGNPKLKAEGVKVPFTLENLKESQKCSEDAVYFIKNYVKIVSLDKGTIPFSLWPFQEDMLKVLLKNRFSIFKCPRQIGKSVTTCAFLLHTILFSNDQNICILANKYKTAQKLLSELKKSYMLLPMWMQQGVVEWNKGNIELENGCKIMASSTSSDAIRGNAFNIIFLDEFAFVPAHIADEFFDSVYPTISSGNTTKVIIVSTPRGHNKYHKMWVEANFDRNSKDPSLRWNGYVPFSITWRQVPGRTEAWREETIARTSEQQFRQEFECEFIGSSNTLLSPEKLTSMTWRRPSSMRKLHFGDDALLDIYYMPEQKHQYVLSADVAGGKEQDFSAFVIVDITYIPYRVVAKYQSNKVRPMLYADVIFEAATMYHNAFVLIEVNELGNDVSKTLHQDLEYENIITSSTRGHRGPQVGSGFTKNVDFGVRTNKASKKQGCSNLKTLIETEKLIVEDYQIYEELNRFVSNSKGSFSAEEGSHDDLVMSLVNFSWLVNQRYFKELTDSDIYGRLKADYEAALEEDMPPFGFIVSATDGFHDDDGVTL